MLAVAYYFVYVLCWLLHVFYFVFLLIAESDATDARVERSQSARYPIAGLPSFFTAYHFLDFFFVTFMCFFTTYCCLNGATKLFLFNYGRKTGKRDHHAIVQEIMVIEARQKQR